MSAPDNIVAPWEKYLSTVDCLVPSLCSEQRELRARLMLARDLALGRMRDASVDAWELWQVIYSVSSRWVFERADADQLETVRRALVRLALAANSLEAARCDG